MSCIVKSSPAISKRSQKCLHTYIQYTGIVGIARASFEAWSLYGGLASFVSVALFVIYTGFEEDFDAGSTSG